MASKGKSPKIQLEQAEARLRVLMPGRFRVSYDPVFPGSRGQVFSWFQVAFEVGPGKDSAVRAQVHCLFEKILIALADLSLVYESDFVSLRARRHFPDSETYNPDHPFMYIESDWNGPAIQAMRKQASFASWMVTCLDYYNRFDRNDPLTQKRSEQDSSSVGA